MISPISIKNNSHKTAFKGSLQVLTTGLELCNKYPMVGVSVIDGTTAIVPRTVVDAQTNGFLAAETFRKESMGLIVNCLTPSLIVLGMAKAVQPFTMGKKFSHLNMASTWANEDTLNKLSGFYKDTKGTTEERINTYTKKVLSNLEGFNGCSKPQWETFSYKSGNSTIKYTIRNTESANEQWKSFADKVDEASKKLADLILNSNTTKKETKKVLSEVFKDLADKTKTTEIIRFQGDKKAFSSNLSEILRDTVDLGKRFKDKTVSENLGEFVKRSTKLVNRKSLVGMAVIIPLAMSVQFINRAITKWHSGHDGAPIYKNFGVKTPIKMEADKKNLSTNKMFAAAGMIGTTLLTNTKGFSKKLFQYKGLFPTLDQCRWIATATIISRMFACADNNELKETTVRDGATFLGLYALGDGVAKGTASIIEKVKPNVKLLSKEALEHSPKNLFEKVTNWLTKTHLKSFSEVSNNAKQMRSLCQIAHLGSAMLVLGLAIPRYVRSCTERKEAKMREIIESNAKAMEKIKNMKPNAFASFRAYYKK